jgi:PhzF family phenazine biosynthesis protein
MSARRFTQVDVFTTRAGYGNALAVVLDGAGFDDALMQRLATWTNLSETTFVLPPTAPHADFRLRIFTPHRELPFAGHPTVGTTHALLASGGLPTGKTRLLLECAAGVLPVRIDGEGHLRRIFVQVPTPRLAPIDASLANALADAFGTEPNTDPAPCNVDVGPVWLVAQFDNARAVRSLRPDFARLAALTARCGAIGVSVFGREQSGHAQIAVRAFCPGDSIPEDPVTGSANAAIGGYLRATGGLARIGAHYRVSQGREVGRDGYVDVEVDTGTGAVMIGGACVTCVTGTIQFEPDA